jgi:hypothetical protein
VIWLDPEALGVEAGAGGDVRAMAALDDGSVVVATDDHLELLAEGGVMASLELPPGLGRVTKLVPG